MGDVGADDVTQVSGGVIAVQVYGNRYGAGLSLSFVGARGAGWLI